MSHKGTKTTSATSYLVSLVNFNETLPSSVSYKRELLDTVEILVLVCVVFV